MGSIAAACECEIDGNQAIEVNKVKNKILSLKENLIILLSYEMHHRRNGSRALNEENFKKRIYLFC